VNRSEPYPEALPVLIDHLERGGYPDRVMDSLARALAVKPAVSYWDRLKARYLLAGGPQERDGVATDPDALSCSPARRQALTVIYEMLEPLAVAKPPAVSGLALLSPGGSTAGSRLRRGAGTRHADSVTITGT